MYTNLLYFRGKRDVKELSIEDLANMDEYDCGKQYLCEMTALMAAQNNIKDPIVLDLLQVDPVFVFIISEATL